MEGMNERWCVLKLSCFGGAQGASSTQSKPGLADMQNFKPHWSVDFWRDFSVPPSISDPSTPIPSRYVVTLCACMQSLLESLMRRR